MHKIHLDINGFLHSHRVHTEHAIYAFRVITIPDYYLNFFFHHKSTVRIQRRVVLMEQSSMSRLYWKQWTIENAVINYFVNSMDRDSRRILQTKRCLSFAAIKMLLLFCARSNRMFADGTSITNSVLFCPGPSENILCN